MTNKKLKTSSINMNMLVTAVIKANHAVLCRILVAMNDSGKFGTEMICRLIDGYTNDVIPGYHEISDCDLQTVFVERELNKRGVTIEELARWVQPLVPKSMTSTLVSVIGENVGIFFVHLNREHGYGRKRFFRILSEAQKLDGGYAVKECEKRFNLIVKDADHLQSFDNITKKRKHKIDNDQFRQKQRELEAFRRITEKAV